MIIEKTKDQILIRISPKVDPFGFQRIMDYLEYLEITSKSKAKQSDADKGAVSRKYYEDALHIAMATIHKASVLASWNFKHIVNLERIRQYNAVNIKKGYALLEIRSPREIVKIEDNE